MIVLITNINYSILKRKDNKYYSRISYYENGVRKQRQRGYFDLRKDCVEVTENYIHELENYVHDALPFDKIAREYLKYARLKLKASTLTNYKVKIEKFLIPHFKHANMRKFTKRTLKNFEMEILKTCTSDANIHLNYVTFKNVINYAVEFYDLENKHLDNLKLPKLKKSTRKEFITLEEFNDFIKTINDKKYHTIYSILFFTGMRIGELQALQWQDIDLVKGTISITKTYDRYTSLITDPKSEYSVRTILINDELIELIKEWQNEYKETATLDPLNYVIGRARPISYATIYTRFTRDKKHFGNRMIVLHTFRHSHASDLINRINANAWFIAKRLGHKDPSLIMKTYGHLYDDTERMYVNLI